MRRARLAPAFVTTVLSSGCAWTYGGAVQYTNAFEQPGGVAVSARGAWGFGVRRNTLTVAADLGVGASPSRGNLWVQGTQRLEWSWLPAHGGLGLRLAGGGLVAGAGGGAGLVAGPLLGAEGLYGLNVGDDQSAGYRATLVGFGAYFAYDVAGEVNGPVVMIGLSLTRDGTLPFGNPPPPRLREPPPPTLQVATDPAR